MAIHNHSIDAADGDEDDFGNSDDTIRGLGREHRSCFVVDQVVSSASVTHAVWGRFRAPDVDDVVLGKSDQLQLLVRAPNPGDGTERMRLAHQQPLHGTLVDLKVIPCAAANEGGTAGADLLGILSDSGKLSIVKFDEATKRFAPVRQLHLAPPGLPSLDRRTLDEALRTSAHSEPFFVSLAVDPRARCVAVRCDTHVSVFFTSHAGDMNRSGSTSSLATGGWTNHSAPGTIEFDSAGTPLRPNKRIVLDAAFAPTGGDQRPCLVLLLMETASDDPDHPLVDRESRTPHVDVFHNLSRQRLVDAPTQPEWTKMCDGIAVEVCPRGMYDASTAPTYRIRLLDAIVPRGVRTTLVEPPRGYRGTPFVGVVGSGAVISIGLSDPSAHDGSMPRCISRVHDTVEEESDREVTGSTRAWVWDRAWVTADPRSAGASEPPPRGSKTGRWVWVGSVATGGKRACLRVKLAIDADGASVDELSGVSVPLSVVDVPAAALSLGVVAGRTNGQVAVFGRNGAVDVVTVAAGPTAMRTPKKLRHAPDATALLCNLDSFDAVPPRGLVTEIISASDDASTSVNNPSYILASGGSLTRVAPGVATSVVPVSPPGFESVTSMWGLRFADTLLVLSFSEQTRVFAVGGDGSTFEEAVNGAGVDTGETTVACGEFGDDVFAQVTPRRVHLCRASDKTRMSTWDPGLGAGGIGAATVASHGRVALALPRRGSVVVLACRRQGAVEARRTRSYAAAAAQSDARELVALVELSYRHEPSCLVVPPPSLASMMLDAMHASAPSTVPSSTNLGAYRWSMVLMGTYGGSLDVVVAHERDEGYDSSRGDEVPPLPGTEGTDLACDTTLPLRDDSSNSVGVPSAVHVARWGDEGDERPVVMLATRSGEILRVEPVPVTADMFSPLPRPPSPPPPPPRRLIPPEDVDQIYGKEVEVMNIGVDEPHGESLNPLELALSEPKPSVDVDACGETEVERGTTEAASHDGSLLVTFHRKLCTSPLALVSLSDRPEGPVVVLGHGDSWLIRGSPGCQRASAVRLDAPSGILTATKFSPPGDASRRVGESMLAVIDGRLALVSPSLEQRDAASRCDADARLGEDGRVSDAKFLCKDIATGRAVTVTPSWVSHEDDGVDPDKMLEMIDKHTRHPDEIRDEDTHTVWEIRAWPPSSRPPEEAEEDEHRSSASVLRFVLDARPSPQFRVTALASCLPPKGVIGGIIAIGTSQLPLAFKRRQHAEQEPEGRLFIFRLVDDDEGEGSETKACGPCLAQAACIALPTPVTTVTTAGPGVLFVGSGTRVYCVRIGPRDDDDDLMAEGSFPARIPAELRELGPGDPKFDSAYLSQSLSVTLVAQTSTRRGVTGLAAGPPLGQIGDHTADVARGHLTAGHPPLASGHPPLASEHPPVSSGHPPLGHYPMLGGEADVSETEGFVPVAVAGAREGVSLSVLKTVDTDAVSRLVYPEFTPVATDGTVRTVRAMAMRRRGEVVGVDTAGRIFVLQNRNAPERKKRSADEQTDDNNGNGGRRKPGPCSPERNLTIAASFTLRSSPTAMLLLPDRLPKYPALKPVAPEARACYDRSVACQRGASFIVGTAEGGVCSVAEIDERDWAVLHEVQSRARTHPLTAPVLGASHENAHGAWPPRAGFGPPGPPAPLWPSVAEANAARAGSSAAPEVIDGSLLRELLEMPERAQRDVLSSGESRLPVETVLGLIQRVLET